jgi:hypothetical protein
MNLLLAPLFSLPWLVAIAWVVVCSGGEALLGTDEPSTAEAARRRLAVR